MAVSGGGSHAFDWVRTTKAGTFWSKLNAVDFMNSSLQFAALAVVCLFPFLITVSAESGGDARHALIARLGLDERAARDVDALMSSGSHTVTTLSIVGAVFVLLGAMGIASTLQIWYQRVFNQPPAQTLWRQLTNRLLWLAGLLGYLTVQDFSFIQLKQAGGCTGSCLRRDLHPCPCLLLVDPPRPAVGQGCLASAFPCSRRDGCVRDRSRCCFSPRLLIADRVESR
jgi:hypothetical protein